jgi:hypothetical protein
MEPRQSNLITPKQLEMIRCQGAFCVHVCEQQLQMLPTRGYPFPENPLPEMASSHRLSVLSCFDLLNIEPLRQSLPQLGRDHWAGFPVVVTGLSRDLANDGLVNRADGVQRAVTGIALTLLVVVRAEGTRVYLLLISEPIASKL